jgi:hypothetical protein
MLDDPKRLSCPSSRFVLKALLSKMNVQTILFFHTNTPQLELFMAILSAASSRQKS